MRRLAEAGQGWKHALRLQRAGYMDSILEQISCYSMLPWHLKIKYYDETSGRHEYLHAKPGTPEFEAAWAPFLQDFHHHMQEKGLTEKTCIAIDERPDYMVREAMRLIQAHAPTFRIASAVDMPSELTRDVYNISPVITHAGTALGDMLSQRKASGKKTLSTCACILPPQHLYHLSPGRSRMAGLFLRRQTNWMDSCAGHTTHGIAIPCNAQILSTGPQEIVSWYTRVTAPPYALNA